MKQTVYIILMVISLYPSASQGQEITGLTTAALDREINPYRLPLLSDKKGYLEKTKLALGALIKSHHFNKYGHHDYNESHNGVYININQWSTGTYTNSSDEQSIFVTYNPNLYKNKSFKINFVTGVANGYDGWEYAQGDYLPILGASLQWGYIKTVLSYDVAAFGIELPLN